jgi:hypothetical protein
MARQYIGINLVVDNTQKLTVQNFVKERGEAKPFLMNVPIIAICIFCVLAAPVTFINGSAFVLGYSLVLLNVWLLVPALKLDGPACFGEVRSRISVETTSVLLRMYRSIELQLCDTYFYQQTQRHARIKGKLNPWL